MLNRSPMEQAKTGNTSENAIDKIHQMIYSSFQEKQTTKKVYGNIMNSIKV